MALGGVGAWKQQPYEGLWSSRQQQINLVSRFKKPCWAEVMKGEQG
jgi:hypothetical protein